MKIQTKYLFIIKIIANIFLSILGTWLFVQNFYFSAVFIWLSVVGISVSLYQDRQRLIDKMNRMIMSIRHSDFSYNFTNSKSKDEINNLHQEMNEALTAFRNRTQNLMMDETETKAWQKLISVLTHEIMNSIAPIISLSETLSEEKNHKEVSSAQYKTMHQAMEIIHKRSKGLLTFVENYRKLTRIPEPILQPIYLEQMLNSLQQLVASDKINFTYSVYPEKLTLNADRNMLEQVLINLLKNAHEAGKENTESKVNVTAAKIGNEVHISVKDNGCGISSEAIDKIFIPFYSTKTSGSGIGLSLCRQIMLRHNGKITVQSNEKGSIFTLIFK
ncbi:hypothetical protein CAPN001_16180 [Capnocytophaga stomatis]|uniref:sensor histidine kinase n=1 Tax=Capnocytophaga stomatis TaxID=1848904 RepID=UPI001951CCF1|nr:HAMP domain-containing sensor histidine kinase [Capnocytophaga stomatis]GIJ95336.1 hypothetical protein CAPN002_25540 [Capnocytophaga stomatis]GIJ97049.1 hypothetical protein CAPN001_16180 [Capnocytophaga stomatis]